MKKLTHWRCSRCRTFKKLRTEIARADMHAVCFSCQRGQTSVIDTDAAAGQEQPAYVKRRIVRRNGRDNREVE